MKDRTVTRIVLALGCLWLANCERQEEVPEELETAKEHGFDLEEIHYGQLEDVEMVSEVFRKIGESPKKGLADKGGLYEFTIDSSRIRKLVLDGRTTYTFLVKRKGADLKSFENLLIFKDERNETKAYLLEYDMERAEWVKGHRSFSYDGAPR